MITIPFYVPQSIADFFSRLSPTELTIILIVGLLAYISWLVQRAKRMRNYYKRRSAARKSSQGRASGNGLSQETAPVATATKIKLTVDGRFGPHTKARLQQWVGVPFNDQFPPSAWRAVQRRVGRGLVADGVVGPETWSAIQNMVGSAQDGIPGPNTIRALQSYLNTK